LKTCQVYYIQKMDVNTYYHIYNRANGSENLFRKDENYGYFLKKWGEYISPVADTYAYCLMPNHFHFLVKIKTEVELKDLTGFENLSGLLKQPFSNLFNGYAKAYNNMYNRKGSLFQRPFKQKPIDSEAYLKEVIFYIHHNPVHHGFTKQMEDWPYSSFPALLTNRLTRACL